MHASITAAYLARYRSAAADSPTDLLPLTGAQRRFLITRRLAPQGRPEVVPLFHAYPGGTLDLPRLARAATTTAARHPALCGGFGTVRGTPVLRVGAPSAEAARIAVPPGGTAGSALREALLDWPADGPALRLLVAREPDGEEELLALAVDHAACDEQSLGILTADLTDAYARDDHAQEALAAPDQDALAAYREAVERQLAAEDAAGGPAAQAHWGRRLGGVTGTGGGAAGSTGMLSHRLPAAEGAARTAFFPALLDATAAAAHRLHRTDGQLALGYPWGGRPPGAPAALGCFLNTLVHPAVPGAATALEDLADAWWDDLDHADTPFDEVVRAARTAGAPWTGALDGMLTLEDLHRRPPLVFGGVPGREIHLAGRPLAAPFAVAASHGDDLLVRLAWDRERFPEDAATAAFDDLLATLRRHLRTA
ncbi:non-ribosomal peptide synthetase [Kitasatospora sp. NPDC127121]|uniref:non-ribosomal peptide synthetase n=1 Tax=Kitasatospora sp. NPDC127121 TaxID=3345371 RepID=UPI0036283853